MLSNPEYITTAFFEKLTEITDSVENNYRTMTLSLMTDDGELLSLTPQQIAQFTMDKNFFSNYRDMVEVDIVISKNEHRTIMADRQNITAVVKIYQINDGTSNTIVFNKSYKCILRQQHDREMSVPSGEVIDNEENTTRETATETVTLELITYTEYEARKHEFNMILRDATMRDTLMYIAKLIGFSKVYIVQPDNETTYKNVIIPPILGLSNVFIHLQENSAYGVYNEGINHYIHDDVLYIYPMHKNNSAGDIVNIYNGGEGAFAGFANLSMKSDAGLDIIATEGVRIMSLSQSNIESVGNSFMMNRSKLHKLELGSVTANDVYAVRGDLVKSISLYDDDVGISKGSFKQKYLVEDNEYRVKSMMTMNNAIMVNITWPHALFDCISPVANVGYQYDKDKQTTTISGWPLAVKYTLVRHRAADIVFTCTANLSIGLMK